MNIEYSERLKTSAANEEWWSHREELLDLGRYPSFRATWSDREEEIMVAYSPCFERRGPVISSNVHQ